MSDERGRRMRGGLIATCSAVATVGAHTGAGGALPHGSPLLIALLVCVTSGALAAGPRFDGLRARSTAVVAGLVSAQALGHMALAVTDGHHGGMGTMPTAPMAAAHLVAAVLLGVAIAAVEYLTAVCTSVLCWLRLFAALAERPAPRRARRTPSVIPQQRVLFLSGLGMRAPPSVLGATCA